MSDVTLRHPDLPDDQWITVAAESRAHYSPAGWQLVSDEEVADRASRAAHAVAVADATMAGLPLPSGPAPVLVVTAGVAEASASGVGLTDGPPEEDPKPTTRKRSS